jgi:hypothetical protein
VETWAEIVAKRPDAVRKATLDWPWDRERLWGLELPTDAMPIATLEWLLDVPLWRTQGQAFTLLPRDVLGDPQRHRDHHERTLNADLAYPIDVTFWRGRWIILDGIHRLLKAVSLGVGEIAVRKVPPEALMQLVAR